MDDPCNCSVYGRSPTAWGEHKDTCPQTGLLQWRVSSSWMDRARVYRGFVDIFAHTAIEAIHRAYRHLDLEPRHSIVFTSKSRNRTLLVDRFHYDVDGDHVVVEESITQYPHTWRS